MKRQLPAKIWIRWNYDADPPYMEVAESFKDAVSPLGCYETQDFGRYSLEGVERVEIVAKATRRKGKKPMRMTRPRTFYLLVAVLLAWVTLEGLWAYQDSHRAPNPCGQYFQEDATQ